MKYFLLGAFSSAFFLYGIAFVYGATGEHEPVPDRGDRSAGTPTALGARADRRRAARGGVLLQGGAVPFHMWTPDAYQGAPTNVTAFMSAGTKVAAFAAFVRVFLTGLVPLADDWRPMSGAWPRSRWWSGASWPSPRRT